jgi:tyrosyl-tRNA synthetase
LDDPKVHGKSKMKKAFCEPGNVGFCPPIEVLAYFGGLIGGGAKEGGKAITISQSDNGGDVTYTAKEELLRDFSSGSLHPGDLKAAESNMMVDVLTKLWSEIKGDDAASKGVKGSELDSKC